VSQQYSAQELLKISVSVENNGKKLYEKLENKTGDAKLKALWKYLKDQESEHAAKFQGMLDAIGDSAVKGVDEREYEAYFSAIASLYVFSQSVIKKAIDGDFKTDREAVEFAIGIEKDSILTYSALREYLRLDKQGGLEKIIREEQKHLIDLLAVKQRVK